MKRACREVDSAIGKIVARVKELGLLKNTTIIIMGDHGMSNTPITGRVFFAKVADVEDIHYIMSGPVAFIYPKKDKIDKVRDALSEKPAKGI